MLNFFRRATQDYTNELGEARIICAKLQSRVGVSVERANYMKEKCTTEKIAKQKAAMRYVREIMRISDVKRIIHEICLKAQSSLDEIDVRRRDILAAFASPDGVVPPDHRYMKELITQLGSITEQLVVSTGAQTDENKNDPTAPIGTIELRMPEMEVDDETLHGIVGLLCGALGPAAAATGQLTGDGLDDAVLQNGGLPGDGMSKSQLALISSGLNQNGTSDAVSAAAIMAKSILLIQSNYSERVLLLNLSSNSLTDISCKVLSALVEKSTVLRMLDLRGNLISPDGIR